MLKKLKLILCALTIMLFTVNVSAKENVIINKLYGITEPELAGAFDVTEVIEVSGSYDEFNIDLYYKDLSLEEFSGKKSDLKASSIYNGSSITINQIGKLNIEELDFSKFIDTTSNYIEDNISVFEEETYKQELTDEKLKLSIYNNDKSETNYYYIKYTIHNLIVEHNDYAELKYYYLDGSLNYDIKELIILSNLPFPDPDFKIWVHGPKNGEAIKIEEGNGAILNFKDVKKNTKIDIRMLYNLNLFPLNINENKKSNLDSLQIIEEIENEIQNKTDKKIMITNIVKYIVIVVTIIYYLTYLFIFIKEYVKYLKNRKLFNEKYYKNGFNNITSIMKLLNIYTVNTYLLDMISRDVIKYKDNNVIVNKDSKYKFIDESVIKTIFESNDKISLKELNSNKKDINIKEELNNLKYDFNNNIYNKILFIIFSLLGILVSILFAKVMDFKYLVIGIILCILSILFLTYLLFNSFYDKNGKELSNKYKAFIRYIKKLDKEATDLKLFSNYLVVLSIKNKNLINKLNSKYEEEKGNKNYKYEKVKEFMDLLD